MAGRLAFGVAAVFEGIMGMLSCLFLGGLGIFFVETVFLSGLGMFSWGVGSLLE